MIHKLRKFDGLNELPVFIEDETELSPDYFDVTYLPKTLHAGKNLVRLKANDETLKIGSALLIEILDFNGDPIYYEVADFLYEDKSRIISLWIYEDTPPGEATLVLMGEVDEFDGVPVPDEYKNLPNVRWKGYFSVDNTKRNDSEIIFADDNKPALIVEEKIRPYLDRSYETTQFVTQSVGTIDYELSGQNPTITIAGDRFKREHLGASIKITPNNAIPTLDINVTDSTYWTTIKSLPTTSSAVLDEKYYLVADDTSYTYTADRLTNCVYEIHYEDSPIFTDTQNLRSLARLQVNNIDPAVGEVSRAKSFIKSKGSSAAWELVDDTVLKESELQDILIDTGSIDVKTRIGNFVGQQTIDSYWTASLTQRQNGNTILDPTQFVGYYPLTYDSGSELLDSMFITAPSTYPQQFVKVTNPTVSKDYEKDGQYDLQFNALSKRSSQLGAGLAPYIEFYISGSAFSHKKTESSFGEKIGELDVSKIDPNAKGTSFRFENEKLSFFANDYGKGTLILKVNSGDWYISDLSIVPSTELGFNPCQNTVLIALPTEHINDQLDFKVEYFDYQGQQSKYISYCDSCEFEGGNTYIGGVKNLLTGSLFVGNGTGSGVEINGITGGFVRSIGYDGFDLATSNTGSGFAIWSGSGFGQYNSEDYDGVGLELHAGGSSGSLLFRTHPTPRFEVITPSFFFGNPNGAFISGSNGNIQISSSNFQLSPGGSITATDGVIGGWTINADRLYAQAGIKYVGMAAPAASTTRVFWAGSTITSPPNQGTTGSNAVWHVKTNGQMTASGVYVTSDFPTIPGANSPMINTSTGIAEGINLGRQIYHDSTEYIVNGAAINSGSEGAGFGPDIPFYLQPGETSINVTYMAKYTKGSAPFVDMPMAYRGVSASLFIAEASITGSIANQEGVGSYDAWTAWTGFPINTLVYSFEDNASTGTVETGSINGQVNDPIISSYQGKQVKLKLGATKGGGTGGGVGFLDVLQIKNIVITTGRLLGSSNVIREEQITQGGTPAE